MTPPRIVVVRATAAEPLGEHVTALRDLGWDVHLLAVGEAPEQDAPRVVDGVSVTTVPMPRWLSSGRTSVRSPRWTDPRAYRTQQKANLRVAMAREAVSAAEFRRNVAVAERAGRAPLPVRGRLVLAKARRRWVAARAAATREAYRRRKARQRLTDKVARRWWRLVSGRHAWARLHPGLLDAEVHLGPALDQIRADAIHAEGAVVLSVALRSASRRDEPVKVVWDTAGEYRPKQAWIAEARRLLADEYGPRADAVLDAHDPASISSAYRALSVGKVPAATPIEGTS